MKNPENKSNSLRVEIEASILRVALETIGRKGTPEGTVFSPAHMAKLEAERIVKLIKRGMPESG